jgi:hypothetical protein
MRRSILFSLFFLASLGIMPQIFVSEDLSSSILALGTLGMCIEQARMAVVDLEQIAQFQEKIVDSRLDRFFVATVSTIILELLGFYLAALEIGWGALIVLVSQIWFHCLAKIQLQPTTEKIIDYGIKPRLPVLLADGIGIIFVIFWIAKIAPLIMAVNLTAMVLIYCCLKYLLRDGEKGEDEGVIW